MTAPAPLRVAVVTPRFPPDAGGVEEYAAWVAGTLRDRGCEVTVITTGRRWRATCETWHGLPVVRLGTWLTLSNSPVSPLWWWQVRRLLRRSGAEVVNAHAPVPGLADVTVLTSPVPVVLTYHAGTLVKGAHPADPLLRAYERHVLPRIFDRCHALVAVSPVSLAHDTGRAELISPGVDTDLFFPTGAPREQRVLFVGRVERSSRWKGLSVLVDALPRLRAALPGVRLDVVGDGDDVAALQKRAADLGVADLVDWHGQVQHHELPAHYRRAGVTVLPSLTAAESFGMALAEALACGCPVVGSDVGGIPFVVRDGVDGRLVPPGDPDALADALAAVLCDPPQVPPTRWSWEHQSDRTVRVIEEAAR